MLTISQTKHEHKGLKVNYIINDVFNGFNAQFIAWRHGLFEHINDYTLIKRVMGRSNSLLEIQDRDGTIKEVVRGSHVYAWRLNNKVMVTVIPPINKK